MQQPLFRQRKAQVTQHDRHFAGQGAGRAAGGLGFGGIADRNAVSRGGYTLRRLRRHGRGDASGAAVVQVDQHRLCETLDRDILSRPENR